MPEMTTRLLASLGLLIVFTGIAFGGGYLIFQSSSYDPPASPQAVFPQQGITDLPSNEARQPLVAPSANGLILVDAAHRNSFRDNEIVTLLSKIATRGHDPEFLGSFTTMEEAKRLDLFEERLRGADGLAVILPRDGYTNAEADLVENFVRKGGKLLLVSDPTRIQRINSLAERFGVNFQPDYLYNQHENDLNFQHIFVKQFQPEALTAGVDSIALYSAGSIQSSGAGIAFTDRNTESSVQQSGAGLSPIAWGNSQNVLSIGDLTFMIPPHSSALDNDQLLSNVADYLTSSTREFDLDDFPHFYRSGPGESVDIVVAQPSLLGGGAAMKNGLAEHGISASLQTSEDLGRDTVFLGLHEDALRVAGYLHGAGIRVGDSLSGPFGTDLPLENTAITLLDTNRERHVLIILGDTPEVLSHTVSNLLDGTYRRELVNDFASVSSTAKESK